LRKRATLYHTIHDEQRTIRAHLWSATVLRANKLLAGENRSFGSVREVWS
jgi:hypothetical protein